VETCQVVELMFTLEQLVRITDDGEYGDRLESVGYNLLAAANDPRMLAHQYHQQANQVLVSFANRDWISSGPGANVFGLDPHFGCCTANLHQGWPKFVRSLWMVDEGNNAHTAVAYAPCSVEEELGGHQVRLDVDTAYPFSEQIELTVGVPAPTGSDSGYTSPSGARVRTSRSMARRSRLSRTPTVSSPSVAPGTTVINSGWCSRCVCRRFPGIAARSDCSSVRW